MCTFSSSYHSIEDSWRSVENIGDRYDSMVKGGEGPKEALPPNKLIYYIFIFIIPYFLYNNILCLKKGIVKLGHYIRVLLCHCVGGFWTLEYYMEGSVGNL